MWEMCDVALGTFGTINNEVLRQSVWNFPTAAAISMRWRFQLFHHCSILCFQLVMIDEWWCKSSIDYCDIFSILRAQFFRLNCLLVFFYCSNSFGFFLWDSSAWFECNVWYDSMCETIYINISGLLATLSFSHQLIIWLSVCCNLQVSWYLITCGIILSR